MYELMAVFAAYLTGIALLLKASANTLFLLRVRETHVAFMNLRGVDRQTILMSASCAITFAGSS